jgi:hypothetical protein
MHRSERDSRNMISRREAPMNWDFLQRYDESWIWRCSDRHEVTESSRNFAALDECVADAARHGYSVPHMRTGRRRAAVRIAHEPRRK